MASDIKLVNAEILSYNQEANYIDGGSYQFGRTINLDITAFIYPISPSGTFAGEGAKFKKIDNLQKDHIEEILAKGFVDRIEIGPDTPQIIENVKILSYSFPTDANINNKINLLRVNMSLQYYETFDNKSFLTGADPEIYDNIDFLDPSIYAQYFDSFSENFSFSISGDYELSYTHNFNFSLRPSSSADTDLVQKAKELVWYVFVDKAPKVGYIDNRYKNFIREVSERGDFRESYDSITNSYSLSRSVSLKKGAHQSSQKTKKWSANLDYDIEVDAQGVVTVRESGVVQGKKGFSPIETSENLYKNAYDGFTELTSDVSVARARCESHFKDFIRTEEKPDWIEGEAEWNTSDNLSENFVSFGKSINRIAGTINYNMVFTTNPRMHNDAIFEYTVSSSKDEKNITTVEEQGTVVPYYTNRNELFTVGSNSVAKRTFDKMVTPAKVLERIKPIYDSTKDSSRSSYSLSSPKHLVSKSISLDSYGVEINYSFTFQDDKSLRNSTYLRRMEKDDSYEMPVINRQAFFIPNQKTTNFDANQSTLGKKNVNISCVAKRDPEGNTINTPAHAAYFKAASDSITSTLKEELENSAFVNAEQSKHNEYNFFLEDANFSFSSGYDLNYSASLGFVDKRGVVASELKY